MHRRSAARAYLVAIPFALLACHADPDASKSGAAAKPTTTTATAVPAAAPAPAPVATAPAAPAAPTPPAQVAPYCGDQPCPCKHGTTEHPKHAEQTCELEAPATIQGIPCAPGRVEFHPNGNLRFCEQAQSPIAIDGVTCGGNWHIWLHPNRHLARCANIVRTQRGPIPLGGPNVALFDDGSLAMGDLESETTVDGVRCRQHLSLFHDGKLQGCPLAMELERGGVALHPGDIVLFNKDGSLRRVQFQNDLTIDGKPVKSGIYCFDAHGKIAAGKHDCGELETELPAG